MIFESGKPRLSTFLGMHDPEDEGSLFHETCELLVFAS
jgi:hypothetical protein